MGVCRNRLWKLPVSAASLCDSGVGRNGDVERAISAISLAVKGVGRNSSIERPTWLGEDALSVLKGATSVGEESGTGAVSNNGEA
jgi:hypothetical protein